LDIINQNGDDFNAPLMLPVDLEKMEYSHPDVNRVLLAGTLVQDPPLRRTRKGVPVTNFIMVTRPDKGVNYPEEFDRDPCFISVVVWAKQAVQCAKHLHKGSAVIVLGELQSMPNAKPEEGYSPVQISAQWIQYLEKGRFSKISSDNDDVDS